MTFFSAAKRRKNEAPCLIQQAYFVHSGYIHCPQTWDLIWVRHKTPGTPWFMALFQIVLDLPLCPWNLWACGPAGPEQNPKATQVWKDNPTSILIPTMCRRPPGQKKKSTLRWVAGLIKTPVSPAKKTSVLWVRVYVMICNEKINP